jgi:hypothetical protein
VRGVRFLTLLTVVLITFMFGVLYLAIAMPPTRAGGCGAAFPKACPTCRLPSRPSSARHELIVGSLTAFAIGQLVDALVFRRFSGSRAIDTSGCGHR